MEVSMSTADFLSYDQWQWLMWSLLGFAGAVGLVAAISPRLFSRLTTWCNIWVDTENIVKKLDRRIEIDQYVVRHSRLFGILVVAVVLVLTAFLV
jgi:hypothetical protein